MSDMTIDDYQESADVALESGDYESADHYLDLAEQALD